MLNLKILARVLGTVLAWPYLATYMMNRLVLDRARAFSYASECVARVPGLLGVCTRQAFYRRVLARVGRDVHFGFMSVLSKPQATIGDRVYIGRFCVLGDVDLGDDVMLGDGVQVLSGRRQHGAGPVGGQPVRENAQQFQRVSIGAGAWLGANAVVMNDVGQRAVVGAGAVVVKPVPAETRVGGVPAQELAQRPAVRLARSA